MKKKETEFLTEEEAQAILRVPDRRTLHGKRDYAILLTLLTTGLRKAEICNLKVGDLKTYRNQPVVDLIGKGQKFRRIPLKPGKRASGSNLQNSIKRKEASSIKKLAISFSFFLLIWSFSFLWFD